MPNQASSSNHAYDNEQFGSASGAGINYLKHVFIKTIFSFYCKFEWWSLTKRCDVFLYENVNIFIYYLQGISTKKRIIRWRLFNWCVTKEGRSYQTVFLFCLRLGSFVRFGLNNKNKNEKGHFFSSFFFCLTLQTSVKSFKFICSSSASHIVIFIINNVCRCVCIYFAITKNV